ncbi:hypothetical protein AMTR_s00107p00062770 [Amborella trichopoda]|uniref:Uncharacterized protein n=1 Tax=Amborella trichopoda TaxID=13333 RepID=W1NY56_AMBTC|nr:hypothetical protein AMTR_s00107p00062770 [Amborella trichopoda]
MVEENPGLPQDFQAPQIFFPKEEVPLPEPTLFHAPLHKLQEGVEVPLLVLIPGHAPLPEIPQEGVTCQWILTLRRSRVLRMWSFSQRVSPSRWRMTLK